MAGVVIHLAAADATYDMLGIKRLPLYYAGNIAPDCIHERKNYVREMKKYTHMRSGIPDWDFLSPENLNLFHSRLKDFADAYCNKNEERDLYKGYLVHLITDEIFINTIREKCAAEAMKYGISQKDKEFFGFMMRELNGGDAITAKRYPFKNDPVNMLKQSFGCRIKDYISGIEIINGTKWITENYFSGFSDFESPLIMKYENIISFINLCCSEIPKILNMYL